MSEYPKTLIIFRPGSPAATIFQPYQWQAFGKPDQPCLGILVRDLDQEVPGFQSFRPISPDQQTSILRRCHVASSEILLIAPEPGSPQHPIGFAPKES